MVVGGMITAHGRKRRSVRNERSVARAIDYVLFGQGDELRDFDDESSPSLVTRSLPLPVLTSLPSVPVARTFISMFRSDLLLHPPTQHNGNGTSYRGQ